MRALILDIHAQLTAALPAGTPILLPEERETPLAGRKPGLAGGLSGYLSTYPEGFVQIYDPQPVLTTSGVYDEEWASIDAIASLDAPAEALAKLIRFTIGGTPRTGGNIRLIVPPRTERDAVSVRITLQFQVRSAHPR